MLPARRGAVIDTSLRLLGLEPGDFAVHDPGKGRCVVDALTLLETDRFRPELLQPVREMLGRVSRPSAVAQACSSAAPAPGSASSPTRPNLRPCSPRPASRPVAMEALNFEEQIRLMGETRVLLAPHGAGLTNMMFCAAGAHVVEIAEPAYPNPNFYALACAMDLTYWHVPARFSGDLTRHRLDRDLAVDPEDGKRRC